MSARQFTFGSVCSGIEAASVAFGPLGWRAAWFAEIEPFPCAVLAHHHPSVPNLGDMTMLPDMVRAGAAQAPDLLCGGTPCQAFSVAGKRESLADARGNLSLIFCELANAIDDVRIARGDDECAILWENVPGVLSTKDNAFGCFLAGLAGEDGPLEPPEPRPADGKSSTFWRWDVKAKQHAASWADAGAVYGPRRAVAWRTLDAQYFGLAQRRRRVFVVASARSGFDPAQVLFEWDGVRRDTAPSRQAGQVPAGTLYAGIGRRRGSGMNPNQIAGTLQANGKAAGSATQQDAEAGMLIAQAFGGNNTSGPRSVASALSALSAHGGSGRMDFESETFIAHTLRAEGFDASEDSTGRGTPLVPVAFDTYNQSVTGDVTQTLCSRGDTPGGNAHLVPAIAFDCKASGQSGFGVGDIAGTMRAMGRASSHQNGGGHQAVAFTTKLHNTQSNQAGKVYEEYATSLDANSPPPALLAAMQVRRLTPRECERLQGFEDDYTLIPGSKRNWTAEREEMRAYFERTGQDYTDDELDRLAADGPRYKALGNSWAVPCARWIGQRIDSNLNARKAA